MTGAEGGEVVDTGRFDPIDPEAGRGPHHNEGVQGEAGIDAGAQEAHAVLLCERVHAISPIRIRSPRVRQLLGDAEHICARPQ